MKLMKRLASESYIYKYRNKLTQLSLHYGTNQVQSTRNAKHILISLLLLCKGGYIWLLHLQL